MTRCTQCPALATVTCRWGLYAIGDAPRTEPLNTAVLCPACSDDLWRRIKCAVGAGLMHFTCRAL